MKKYALCVTCAATISILTGCMAMSVQDRPNAWLAGYSYSSDIHMDGDVTVDSSAEFITPLKCHPDEGYTSSQTLPLGCAIDKNLQHMVERPIDLIRGQDMGPARAGPVAAAARQRLASSGEGEAQDLPSMRLNTISTPGGSQ